MKYSGNREMPGLQMLGMCLLPCTSFFPPVRTVNYPSFVVRVWQPNLHHPTRMTQLFLRKCRLSSHRQDCDCVDYTQVKGEKVVLSRVWENSSQTHLPFGQMCRGGTHAQPHAHKHIPAIGWFWGIHLAPVLPTVPWASWPTLVTLVTVVIRYCKPSSANI